MSTHASNALRDMLAFFYHDGTRFVVTLGTNGRILETFRTLKETRAFVERHNAEVAASLR